MALPAKPNPGGPWAGWGDALHTAVNDLTAGQLTRGPAEFAVRNYGAAGDGVADDRAACAAAVLAACNYIFATGQPAIVRWGPGTYRFLAGVAKATLAGSIDTTVSSYAKLGIPIPPGLPAALTLDGTGATVKLDGNGTLQCVCVFYADKQADYDVFRKINLVGFTIDDNHTQAKSHVLFGNMPNYGVKMRYCSFEDVTVSGLAIRNADTDTVSAAGAGTVSRVGVAFICDHNGPLEATQTFTHRIVTSGGTMEGGDGLYNFYSTVASRIQPGGVNHRYDDITIGPGWKHTNTAPADHQLYQTSVYVCGSGYGGRLLIDRGESVNVGDDAIEIGAMMDVEIRDVKTVNPYFESVLLRNTHALDDADRQRVTIRRLRTVLTPALTGLAAYSGLPVVLIQDDAGTGTHHGTIVQEDCVFDGQGVKYSSGSRKSLGIGIADGTRVGGLEFHRCTYTHSGYTYDGSGTVDLALLRVYAPAAYPVRVVVRDLRQTFTGGSTLAAAGAAYWNTLLLDGPVQADVDGMETDWAGVGGLGCYMISAAKVGGGGLKLTARRLRPLAVAASTAYGGVRVYTAGTVSQVSVFGNDFSVFNTAASGVIVPTGVNAARIRAGNNAYQEGKGLAGAPLAFTSAVAWQNQTGHTVSAAVGGGTVSKVERGDQAGVYLDAGLTSGVFTVAPGQYLRVTYTVAPAATYSVLP